MESGLLGLARRGSVPLPQRPRAGGGENLSSRHFEGMLATLNRVSAKVLLQSRFPLAIAAGLLLAAAFPNLGVSGLAWIAPGLMLAAALGRSAGESFRLGYAAGLAHYLASLSWLLRIPVAGFPVLGWVALSAFLALLPALWVWLSIHLAHSLTDRGQAGETWQAATKTLASQSWLQRIRWSLICAALWVGLEMLISRLFGGFPWNLLGASQFRLVPLIQLASLTGIQGLSFLMVWMSVSLLNAGVSILGRPDYRSVWAREIILPMAAMGAVYILGFRHLTRASDSGEEIRATLVQPSIPQTLIWNSENDTRRFGDLVRLTNQALTNATDLLIWPESAIPRMLRYDAQTLQAVTNLARTHGVWMIIGSDDAEPRQSPAGLQGTDYFNASFLIAPDGQIAGRYCKRNLVIFGEYIPLVRWLPFVKWFTPIQDGFTPGDRVVPFDLGGPGWHARTASLICFEDTFPALGRESAAADTDFLVNLTNDGWFGEGPAQWQHAASAAFRAVENGLPLLRCANTGLTCWIDAHGRIRDVFLDARGGVYGAGFLTARIPLRGKTLKQHPTFYHRHGDWFGWACCALATAALLGGPFRLKPKSALK